MSMVLRRYSHLWHTWFSPNLWRRRLVFWAGAIAVGVAAVGLTAAADFAQTQFDRMVDFSQWLPVLITPLGFIFIVYFTRNHFDGSQGSGIPQVIAAQSMADPKTHKYLVSMKIVVGKVLMCIVGLFCGASIGREGPTAQVGAGILRAVGRRAGVEVGPLLIAGAAAGVAAAFNTPLAGIVFGIEELTRSYEQRTSGVVVTAIVLSGLASLALVGNYTYFGQADVIVDPRNWIAVPFCGIIGGLLGGLFSQATVFGLTRLPTIKNGVVGRHPLVFAGACGLSLAILGLLSHNHIYGTGYDEARLLLEHGPTPHLPWLYGLLKLLATLVTAVSGIPGGIFAPSLSAGAGFGAALSTLMPSVPATTVVLLGVVGYFAGVVQAPITAFVIVMEMTNGHSIVIPIMITAFLGFGASRIVCPQPIYHALAHAFLKKEQRRRAPAGETAPPATEAAAPQA